MRKRLQEKEKKNMLHRPAGDSGHLASWPVSPGDCCFTCGKLTYTTGKMIILGCEEAQAPPFCRGGVPGHGGLGATRRQRKHPGTSPLARHRLHDFALLILDSRDVFILYGNVFILYYLYSCTYLFVIVYCITVRHAFNYMMEPICNETVISSQLKINPIHR